MALVNAFTGTRTTAFTPRIVRTPLPSCATLFFMPINVAVIGAGSWGTTVAALAAVNTPTILWARRAELAAQINDAHVNGDYLPNFMLPEQLRATSSMEEAVSQRRRSGDGGSIARIPRCRRRGRASSSVRGCPS